VVRPLAALRYGRLRIATSGSGGLLDFGTDTDVSGVSLDLVQSPHWKLRTGLRISGGRPSSDSDNLAGLPDVRKTVLGRASATYLVSRSWSAGTTLNVDLLGRGTGLFATTGLTWRHPVAVGTELQVGAGFTVANATHLDSYYGVPDSARTATRPAYSASAGLKDAGVGITLTSALASRWVAFAGLRYTRLLGSAADSPLVPDPSDVAATVGIAWRCCR
jgi:outer membrane scaffolding protein for murein synthesis (MipA/OmpV family)